jgi:hypothetical protein
MALSTMGEDECVARVRFVPEGKGLVARFQSPDSDARYAPSPEPGECRRDLSVAADISQHHGIITFPVRLPRYLMPEWSQDDWVKFVVSEIGFFHDFIDEAVVQGLSLAIVADGDRRKEVIRTANEVVIDFRGDLPNKYLAMMLGGYKVGVYRSGNNWPIWLSIQPTYDLAVKEAESIAAEAGLPKGESISAAGALSRFLKTDLGPPLLINSSPRTDLGGWMAAAAIAAIGLVAWLMK